MYSPSQLHAYYREHFATQGFPALFIVKTFAVQSDTIPKQILIKVFGMNHVLELI